MLINTRMLDLNISILILKLSNIPSNIETIKSIKIIKFLKYNDIHHGMHRLNGPAYMEYDENKINCVSYYKNGQSWNNNNGPTQISFYNNGNVQEIQYNVCNDYLNNPIEYRPINVFHRLNGPALMRFYKNGNPMFIGYYINDDLHNFNGPAIILYNENGNIKEKKWWEFGGPVHTDRWVTNNRYKCIPIV